MKRFFVVSAFIALLAITWTPLTMAKSHNDVLIAKSSARVRCDLMGKVGGQNVFLYINGRSGYYTTDDGARRTVKVVSYGGGRMVLKAYLRGKYIGTFSGSYQSYNGYMNSYSGSFSSVRGGSLSFYLDVYEGSYR